MSTSKSQKDLTNSSRHIEGLAKLLTDTLVKPTIGKDVRLKYLEPLPYIVWKDGKLVKYEDTLPTIKARSSVNLYR